MAEAILLGRMTDTMEEGFLAELNIKVGDKIKAGDTLAEVETDKATLPLESYFTGTILYVAAKKGDTLKINDLIAIVGKEGEDFSKLLNIKGAIVSADSGHKKQEEKTEIKNQKQEAPTFISNSDNRIKASPLARTIAREKGIDLRNVQGTGEEGRITKKDLENINLTGGGGNGGGGSGGMPAFVSTENFKDVRISQMRKTIAKRLSESKFGAPHFYLTIEVNMDNAISLRAQLNKVLQKKISFNDMVIKATALALKQNPNINCSWLGDTIRYYNHVHIGMAVAVEEGLLVPVIKFADGKDIRQISTEAKTLAEKAVNKKLLPQEMEGNTFTISNLGMFGIEEFTAIINPPDACILAVGAIRQTPAVINGEIKPAGKMKLTLSCDHRVVDGASGAKFLQSLQIILENPASILL